MGDTHHDPIDHHRTALSHSGATFKDAYLLPGIGLMTSGIVATAVGLASAGYMRGHMAMVVALVALALGALGVTAIAVERRRIRRIDDRWRATKRVEPSSETDAA